MCQSASLMSQFAIVVEVLECIMPIVPCFKARGLCFISKCIDWMVLTTLLQFSMVGMGHAWVCQRSFWRGSHIVGAMGCLTFRRAVHSVLLCVWIPIPFHPFMPHDSFPLRLVGHIRRICNTPDGFVIQVPMGRRLLEPQRL